MPFSASGQIEAPLPHRRVANEHAASLENCDACCRDAVRGGTSRPRADRDRRRYRKISGGHDAVHRLAADAADAGGLLATTRPILRYGVCAARAAAAFPDPRKVA